jgi:hypothetical protein
LRLSGNSMIAKWRRLDGERRLLLLEALLVVTVASAAIRLLPFKQAVRLASRRQLERQASKAAISHNDNVRWAVERAARAVPWRAVCFQKGLALQWMLRRRGIDALLHYGVGHGDRGELQAHVWVAHGDRIVIGGEEAPRFQRVATFP